MLIRNFILPNPFEQLPQPACINLYGVDIVIPVMLLNFLVEPILHSVTFGVVRLYYRKGIDDSAKGSILYLLFYCMHVVMIFIMSIFQFSLSAIINTLFYYFFLQIGAVIIKSKLRYRL
jgi:hypothetical protein